MTDDLAAAIARIDAVIGGAEGGLPEPVFELISRLTPLINIDLLIRDEANRLLLTWRADRFYGPGWHIPGGIVRFKERWEDRIAAVAAVELGTQVRFTPQPLAVHQPMHPTRAIRGHFISLLFDTQLAAPPDDARRAPPDRPAHGQWAWHATPPANLIGVHTRTYGTLLRTLMHPAPGEHHP